MALAGARSVVLTCGEANKTFGKASFGKIRDDPLGHVPFDSDTDPVGINLHEAVSTSPPLLHDLRVQTPRSHQEGV